MNLSEFQYTFPAHLTALKPVHPRSSAKLMVYDRSTSAISHSNFKNLPDVLTADDLLVVNSSMVVPARFYGARETGAKIEGLYLERSLRGVRVWIKGKAQEGEKIKIDGFGAVKILSRAEKEAELEVHADEFIQYLFQKGEVPVPPYIVSERARAEDPHFRDDAEDYQTVFAKRDIDYSVAAPTASLHFDEDLMAALRAKEIQTAEVCLHVGVGTFAPLESLQVSKLHSESVSISAETWDFLKKWKASGKRIVAVGTTVMRTLETAARRDEMGERTDSFSTQLFIKPPFEFKFVDSLITNFHWPDSSLIVLVATFIEAKNKFCPETIHHQWRVAYDEAIRNEYRLFSYGDGLLIR